jgi:RNA polymerase sigma-70 factor (ECF subfamily)
MESDEALYLQLVAGDMAAFDELYRRYERRLFAYVLRQLGDRGEAEDVYHEAFMAVLRERRSGHELASFKAWVFQVARNLCRNRQRQRDRSRRALAREPGTAESSPHAEQLIVEREAPLALERAAMQLPEPMADLYRLRTAGLSYDEIAETLGIPLGTVKSRMSAMLGRLREELHKCNAS